MRPEEGVGFPGTGVVDAYEPPCGYWESNLDALEKQTVYLIAEPSLQPEFRN